MKKEFNHPNKVLKSISFNKRYTNSTTNQEEISILIEYKNLIYKYSSQCAGYIIFLEQAKFL